MTSGTYSEALSDAHPRDLMTAQAALAQAATHIDDAIENLTFVRFDWAFEDTWRAAALLKAATDTGRYAPPALPPTGALGPIDALASAGQPRDDGTALAMFIAAVEDVRGRLPATDWRATCEEHAGTIEQLVFDASDVIIECARGTTLVDPGATYGALAGAWSPAPAIGNDRTLPWTMPRRDALKLIAAGTFGALAACRPSAASAPAESTSSTSDDLATPTTPSVPDATIAAVTPLDAMQWPTSDPFLFCAYHVDHYPAGNGQMGPDASLAGRSLGRDFDAGRDWRMYHGESIPGFPRHPHRGFETVTVVRSGMLDHADSMGATARYGGGDVQWLTAGGGIQHAEMFPLLSEETDNPFELFQIWLNLPASHKMVDSHFTMLWAEDIPNVAVLDVEGRATDLTITAGSYAGNAPPAAPPNSWASQPQSDVAIWTLRMDPGAQFTLPPVAGGTNRSLYVHRGAGARVGERDVPNASRVELSGRGAVAIQAGEREVEVLLLQGRPIGEPVSRRGPFVMNTQDEIRQAYADYQRTGFGGWPWDDNAPVHDATRGRFAQRSDGSMEEPS
ncbi:MAG: redox-sensitive bicupin YhaK (pirin superfamily) [Bradymonadia bacterium]|jgi:redox-sensitive bicupin YhaK (pirin superfamily)